MGRSIAVADIRERNDPRIQDPVEDGPVIEDGLALSMLSLRHLLFSLHDDLLETTAENQCLDEYFFLLADTPYSSDGLGFDLRIEDRVDEVDAGS